VTENTAGLKRVDPSEYMESNNNWADLKGPWSMQASRNHEGRPEGHHEAENTRRFFRPMIPL
jgi:hypothetical protein